MTPHLSPFTVDALALDALPVAEATVARAHLDNCAACQAASASAHAEHAEFLRDVFPRTRLAICARPERRRSARVWWPWFTGAVALAAAVAALLLIVRGDHPRAAPIEPELGIKGHVAWQVVAHRGERTFQVRDGGSLAAGDRIRFVVTTDRARYLVIASVDGNGVVSIYFPYDGTRSGPIEPAKTALEDSIVLDDAPGPERLFAVFSDEPLDVGPTSPLHDQLRAIAARGPDAIRATKQLDVATVAQLSLVFEKTSP